VTFDQIENSFSVVYPVNEVNVTEPATDPSIFVVTVSVDAKGVEKYAISTFKLNTTRLCGGRFINVLPVSVVPPKGPYEFIVKC
jgi:hypothetical protein